MKIVIVDSESNTNVIIGSFDGCDDAESIQKLFVNSGSSDEKVIDFIELSDDDPLDNLFSSLCKFGEEGENSFQCRLEEFLTKIFQLGKKIGEKRTTQNSQK